MMRSKRRFSISDILQQVKAFFQKPSPDPLIYQRQFRPAFWTVSGTISLVVNVILIAVVLILVDQIFTLKYIVQNQLIGGLYQNFARMDAATIKTDVAISSEVRANFTIPLHIDTNARLSQDTTIRGARIVSLTTGGLSISNAPIDIILPAGTLLPIELDIDVPVDQPIPVDMIVPVEIPINQTDLHLPFVGLQQVVSPYYQILEELPDTWQEALCGPQPSGFCRWLIP